MIKTIFLAITLLVSIARAGDWRSYYAINAQGSGADENCRYAKSMGYEYISLMSGWDYQAKYKTSIYCKDLKFYVVDPQWDYSVMERHPRAYDGSTSTPKNVEEFKREKNWYESNMVWKSNDLYPNNLASAWFNGPTNFTVTWDYQQQKVIDGIVERSIALFKSYESPEKNFLFAGYIMDVPRYHGEFSSQFPNDNAPLEWITSNKKPSSLCHDGINQDYATYSEGKIAFLKKLMKKTKEIYPSAKVIYEPWQLYTEPDKSGPRAGLPRDEFVWATKDRADKLELMPDMICQEGPGAAFIDDPKIFSSGLPITKENTCLHDWSKIDEISVRINAGKAAINGINYNWFMHISGNPEPPLWHTITEAYQRLKLVRAIPAWDNANHVPLDQRKWDGQIYKSPNSYIDAHLSYSVHPVNKKTYVVFNDALGSIQLKQGQKLISAQKLNGFMEPSGDGMAEISIKGQCSGDILLLNPLIVTFDKAYSLEIGNK